MSVKKESGSGEHAAVKAYRQKLDSIQDHTLPELEKLNARIDAIVSKSDRPSRHDERRDGDEAPPVDVVFEIEEDPFPSVPPARRCALPPPGWECSREAGHDGPCAARRKDPRAE